MTDRRSWEALQNRWAAGETLSAEEERERLSYADFDALARRELELLAELSGELSAPEGEPQNLALALAGARGVRLRVLGPEGDSKPAQGRRRGRRAALVGAGVAVAAAAATVVWVSRPRPSEPVAVSVPPRAPVVAPAPRSLARSELVFASGSVTLDGKPMTLGSGTLHAGAELRTAEGRACLTIDPSIDVCLDAQSAVRLESLDQTALTVRVTAGTAVAALAPRKRGRFALVGGDVVATAHGTVFAISREPSGSATRVTVMEGEVAVQRGRGQVSLVEAHSGVELAGDRSGPPTIVGRGEEARLYALLSPRELWQGGNVGVLEVVQASPGDRVLVDQLGPFEMPLGVYVGSGRHRITLRSAESPERGLDVDVEAGGTRHLTRAELDGGASTTPASASALLDQARKQLAAGNRRAALAAYRELGRAFPKSSEAITVLVTLGKLELELGAPERALGAFDAYIAHGGPLLPEAFSGRVRALRALGRRTEERRAIEQYLGRYPTGFEAPTLRQRLAALSSG